MVDNDRNQYINKYFIKCYRVWLITPCLLEMRALNKITAVFVWQIQRG